MRQHYHEETDHKLSETSQLNPLSQPSTGTRRRSVRKRKTFSLGKLCIVSVIGFCCLQFGKQFVQFQQIQAEVAYFEQVKQDKLDRQKELEETKALLDDPSYIERVAREHLGFVYDGETLVLPGETVDDDIPEYNPNIKAGDLH